MKLDTTFTKELKKVNGDGSREAKFAFLRPAREATKALSTPQVQDIFDDILLQYGRATVCICVAATIKARQDRLKPETVRWAQEILGLWTNRSDDTYISLVIQDGLHPTKIEWYAASLIRYTQAP